MNIVCGLWCVCVCLCTCVHDVVGDFRRLLTRKGGFTQRRQAWPSHVEGALSLHVLCLTSEVVASVDGLRAYIMRSVRVV